MMSSVALSPAEQVRQWQDDYRRLTLSPVRRNIVPMDRVRPAPPPPAPPKVIVRDILDLRTPEFSSDAEGILARVAYQHGFSVAEIRGPRQFAAIVRARHDAVKAVAHEHPDWSLPKIGRFFNRDHTTILTTLRKMGVRP